MIDPRLGVCARAPLTFQFERFDESVRVLLVNADESGSMQGRTDDNLLAYDRVAATLQGRADVVIVHGFESDSHYELVHSEAAASRLRLQAGAFAGLDVTLVPSGHPVARGRELLAAHKARGSTNPRSHPRFLDALRELLEAAPGVTVELAVLSSSDGGFDGGPRSVMTQEIDRAMRRLVGRCGCLLAANVLVGHAGSPEALAFFTGDPERFENRLLLSTAAEGPGVLRLSTFNPETVDLSASEGVRYTVTPSPACWAIVDGALHAWQPELVGEPVTVTVWRSTPELRGRRRLARAEVTLQPAPVTLDRDGRAVFDLIARSLSDNPYLRESSRDALNALIAPLEQLLGQRTSVVAALTASPTRAAALAAARARVEENTAAIRAVVDAPSLSPRERSSRINLLNHARHLLKAEARAQHEAMTQEALEQELAFYEAHPDHWLVWLQPAIDTLRSQLTLTQTDPGDVVAHLSTRIRTARSTRDGVARAEDRYLDKLLAESRARRDHLDRRDDPADHVPFEAPRVPPLPPCPVSGRALHDGLAAIPFVADRRDLTSGNLMAGGQNVDRMPIDPAPMLSLAAVRELMWGELGQMASPYYAGDGWYNAAIPVLLGPATPAALRDLERAIGWLSSGTSAFAPQMAEAIPGALAVLLGHPDAQRPDPRRDAQVDALLRTTALLSRYRSYPYVAGTSVFDESGAKEPLTVVWGRSVADAAGAACLQTMGCVTSLFARAVAAHEVDADLVADDLFAWGCRNLARSILSAPDPRDGGVEGVRRLAALLHHAVEIEGAELADPTEPPVVVGGSLDARAIAWVLGPHADPAFPAPIAREGFIDALNQWLHSLPPERRDAALDDADAMFDRLDRLTVTLSPPDEEPLRPEITPRAHAGFDDVAALESLTPRRYATPAPRITSVLARMRRVTKAGVTAWCPPADAATDLNPSALAWLEAHSAFYPLRAWLRLVDAGLVGHAALAAHRARGGLAAIAPLPRFLPRLAAIEGGLGAVTQVLRRALAFVVQNAGGYADNQWATSPLRAAAPEAVDAILGPPPAPRATPRAYTGADVLALTTGPGWPKMDADGYLPKTQAIDDRGQPLRPPARLTQGELACADAVLVQRACAAMITDLVAHTDDLVLSSLHRSARQVLGEHPHDLGRLSPEERMQVIVDELVPQVAGRVRGDLSDPRAFVDCANVLHQLVALGGDTRRFRADEPGALVAAEASRLRARAAVEGWPDA